MTCSFLPHNGKVHSLHTCCGSGFLALAQSAGCPVSLVPSLTYKNGAFASTGSLDYFDCQWWSLCTHLQSEWVKGKGRRLYWLTSLTQADTFWIERYSCLESMCYTWYCGCWIRSPSAMEIHIPLAYGSDICEPKGKLWLPCPMGP